jgi:hypothetical protein
MRVHQWRSQPDSRTRSTQRPPPTAERHLPRCASYASRPPAARREGAGLLGHRAWRRIRQWPGDSLQPLFPASASALGRPVEGMLHKPRDAVQECHCGVGKFARGMPSDRPPRYSRDHWVWATTELDRHPRGRRLADIGVIAYRGADHSGSRTRPASR